MRTYYVYSHMVKPVLQSVAKLPVSHHQHNIEEQLVQKIDVYQ